MEKKTTKTKDTKDAKDEMDTTTSRRINGGESHSGSGWWREVGSAEGLGPVCITRKRMSPPPISTSEEGGRGVKKGVKRDSIMEMNMEKVVSLVRRAKELRDEAGELFRRSLLQGEEREGEREGGGKGEKEGEVDGEKEGEKERKDTARRKAVTTLQERRGWRFVSSSNSLIEIPTGIYH